jgi:hypothetical protein
VSRPVLGALAALIAAGSLAACGGKEIDDEKAEDAIQSGIESTGLAEVRSVSCPSGVDVDVGETFDCTVELGSGKTSTVTLKILDEEGRVKPVRETPPR